MVPPQDPQTTFLMQCYNRWEDEKKDKAAKDISNTQNVGLGGVAIYSQYMPIHNPYITHIFIIQDIP